MKSDPYCLEWYQYCDKKYPNDRKGKMACYDTCWVVCLEKCEDKMTYLADLLEDADYEGY
jgi:hypothetical protein